jgi:peptide/nickel transport system substrate-binding protein
MNCRKLFIGAIYAMGLTISPLTATAQNLVYLVQPEPPSLASFLSTSGPIGLVAPKIYDGLFDYDSELQIVPSLAESYDVSEDGKTITFNLRQGVTWHDGEAFTSADVAFTVMDVLKVVHPRGPNTFREVTSIDTPDSFTAVFNLENPAPYMLRALSAYESPMVPKHLLEGQDLRSSDLATNPVGTGPFTFTVSISGLIRTRTIGSPDYR